MKEKMLQDNLNLVRMDGGPNLFQSYATHYRANQQLLEMFEVSEIQNCVNCSD